jgi:hypothetical protein
MGHGGRIFGAWDEWSDPFARAAAMEAALSAADARIAALRSEMEDMRDAGCRLLAMHRRALARLRDAEAVAAGMAAARADGAARAAEAEAALGELRASVFAAPLDPAARALALAQTRPFRHLARGGRR